MLHQSVDVGAWRTWSEYVQDRRARFRGMRVMRKSRNGLWPAELDVSPKGKRKASDTPTIRPQRLYRNVCWHGDPPISVAVSPNGQCIAFGSAKGVELYWVDISTGLDVNRFFSLSRPSEVLHFLPPRRHIDSEHKLRLISSPGSAPAGAQSTSSEVVGIRPSSGTWFTLTPAWRTIPAKHNEGHCRAVPLSDGHHLLFSDEATGAVCLGADMPVGSAEKISRKFILEPPDGHSGSPTLYAAAPNLDNGVRLAVAYCNNIILYSVPIDALRYSIAQQEETIVQAMAEPRNQTDMVHILPHPLSNAAALRDTILNRDFSDRLETINMSWAREQPAFGCEVSGAAEIWPLRVQGLYVGSTESPVALAVDASDAITVWAFGQHGQMKSWCRSGLGRCQPNSS